MRNRPQSSNLTKLIQAKTETQRTVKDPQQYKHNPFRKYYAALVAENGSSSVNLSLYFPNSSQPKEPIRVQMRKDSTCEEVIGYGLYSFVQQREKDCKEMFGTSNDMSGGLQKDGIFALLKKMVKLMKIFRVCKIVLFIIIIIYLYYLII